MLSVFAPGVISVSRLRVMTMAAARSHVSFASMPVVAPPGTHTSPALRVSIPLSSRAARSFRAAVNGVWLRWLSRHATTSCTRLILFVAASSRFKRASLDASPDEREFDGSTNAG